MSKDELLNIGHAVALLNEGQVVGMPTETVYGLAARIDIPSAIEKIFSTKERPFFDPLIVHVASVAQAKTVTSYWGPIAQILADTYWPGPLTMILPKGAAVNSMITSGLDSVGIRMPKHTIALELIQKTAPLAAPSANKFGKTSPTSAEHVRNEFVKENVFVLDGGSCDIGIESTVLLVKEEGLEKAQLSVLRKGHILKSDLENTLKLKGAQFEFIEKVEKKESPGHMKHHYMPPIPLIICQDVSRTTEDILKEVNAKLSQLPDKIEEIEIIKPEKGVHTYSILNLSDDPVLATRELYAKLREQAQEGKDCLLYYRKADQTGERWESLFDRLNKAASLIL